MRTKKALTFKERKELLHGLAPETLQLSQLALSLSIDFDEIIFYINELSSIEKLIRVQLTERMKYYHFIGITEELQKNLGEYELTTGQLEQKALLMLENLETSQDTNLPNLRYSKFSQKQQINKFLELIAPYREFAKASALSLENGTQCFAEIVKEADKVKRNGLIFDERRKFQIQAVKHCITIIDFQGEITPEEMRHALNTDFSDEPDMFEEQVSLVQKSYNTIKDARKALEIKKINYQFIRNTIDIWEFPNGTLLEFPFYGDSISSETFDMMKELRPKIEKAGMKPLVFKHIQRHYSRLNFNQKEQFSQSEIRVITLHKMFNPNKQNPSGI